MNHPSLVSFNNWNGQKEHKDIHGNGNLVSGFFKLPPSAKQKNFKIKWNLKFKC